MDAIYGLRPANFGREGGLEDDDAVVTSDEEQSQTTTDGSAPSPTQSQAQTPTRAQATPSASATPQRVVLGKRKRREEHLTDLREMLTADLPQQERHHEQNLAQEKHHRAQQERYLAQEEQLHERHLTQEEWYLAQEEQLHELQLAARTRELDAGFRREEIAQQQAFLTAFLQLVQQHFQN